MTGYVPRVIIALGLLCVLAEGISRSMEWAYKQGRVDATIACGGIGG